MPQCDKAYNGLDLLSTPNPRLGPCASVVTALNGFIIVDTVLCVGMSMLFH